jgi:hypothetical protein
MITTTTALIPAIQLRRRLRRASWARCSASRARAAAARFLLAFATRSSPLVNPAGPLSRLCGTMGG